VEQNFADSRFQVAVKSIGFTEIGRLGVGPLWDYVSYALGPRILMAALSVVHP
jgi:hypothetical protein